MHSSNTRSWASALLSFGFLAISIVGSHAAVTGHRIVGGRVIKIDKAPFVVQITDPYGLFLCGGSVVAERFVVTAAHCLESRGENELRVVANASTSDGSEGIKRRVAAFYIPDGYSIDTLDLDVAVLKLDSPLPLGGPGIKAIPMCTKPLKSGDYIVVSGWGRTEELSQMISNELRSVRVATLSSEDCAKRHVNADTAITSSMVCAEEQGKKDACSGDSGGPAVRNNELCGVVSWGVGCARDDYPGIYTSIPVVRKFIDEAMLK